MLNSLKYAFAAVTTALAGGYVVTQNTPATQPDIQRATLELASYEAGQNLDRKVTLNLNGSLADVVKWLKSQDINFVVADESAMKRKISLNFQNRPLSEVLDAIASAMGGTWNHKGETYVFQPGQNFFTGLPKDFPMKTEGFQWDEKTAKPKVWIDGKEMDWKQLEKDGKLKFFTEGDFKMPDLKELKEGKLWIDGKEMDWKQLEKGGKFKFFSDGDFKMPDMKNFPDAKFFEFKDLPKGSFKMLTPDGKEPKVRVWVDGKEVKLNDMKGKNVDGKEVKVQIGDGKLNEHIHKQIEESMATARKQMELYRNKDGGQMSAAERQKMEKAMAQAREEMAKAMKSYDKAKVEKEIAEAMKHREKALKEHKGITDAQRKEIELEMKRAHSDMAKAHEEMAKAMKEHKGLSETQRKDIEKEVQKAKEMAKVHKAQADNIRQLMKSLTPAQKELAKKQGHLKLSDLTPAQRKLIDVKSADDSFTLSYTIDGESITIKNK